MTSPTRRALASAKKKEPRVQLAIGQRVKAARHLAGMTQRQVSEAAGIEFRRYRRLEAGAVNPTVRTLLRVAEAMQLNLWRLLDLRRYRATRRR